MMRKLILFAVVFTLVGCQGAYNPGSSAKIITATPTPTYQEIDLFISALGNILVLCSCVVYAGYGTLNVEFENTVIKNDNVDEALGDNLDTRVMLLGNKLSGRWTPQGSDVVFVWETTSLLPGDVFMFEEESADGQITLTLYAYSMTHGIDKAIISKEVDWIEVIAVYTQTVTLP